MSSIVRIISRREVLLAIVVFAWVSVLLDYYVAYPVVSTTSTSVQSWTVIIQACLYIIGAVALIRTEAKLGLRPTTKSRWYNWLIVGMFALYCIVWAVFGYNSVNFNFVYYNAYQVGYIAQQGSLLFFVFAATWRAMRVRNLESAAFVVSALLTMLAYAPLGEMIWVGWTPIKDWLTNVITAGTFTGVQIGIGVGAISLGVRVVLGIERRYSGA